MRISDNAVSMIPIFRNRGHLTSIAFTFEVSVNLQ